MVYIIYLIVSTKKSISLSKEAIQEELDKNQETEEKPKPFWILLILTVVGLFLVILGSRFVVDSATFIAKKFG